MRGRNFFPHREGTKLRPEGPKPEARRAESGAGVLGESHQLEGLESAVSSPVGSGAEPRKVLNFVQLETSKFQYRNAL